MMCSSVNEFKHSAFFKKYVDNIRKNAKGPMNKKILPYEVRSELSNDMGDLGLIPFNALEDAYSEERELQELLKFKDLYKEKI